MTEPYEYLDEDLGDGDVTSDALIPEVKARASMIANEDCVLAGTEEATRIFEYVGLNSRHCVPAGMVARLPPVGKA